MDITTVAGTTKLCSTCSRWGGPREAVSPYPAYFVRVEVYSKGLCMGGGFSYAETNYTALCHAWKKWEVLR